jgi:CopG family transcriptional regulator, nickel-responsive regulator
MVTHSVKFIKGKQEEMLFYLLLLLIPRSATFFKKVAPMKSLVRFGVSIEDPLLRRFDRFIARTGYENRSEAFRDLIRSKLVEEEVEDERTAVLGVLSLVYDHHKREVEKKLTEVQHLHHHTIISATHVHVDHDNCLEVILLKGTVKEVRTLASSLSIIKGVKHGKLTLTSTLHHA